MRLTVGPLPAAIYWRRRLLVLAALVLVVVAIIYACTSGPGTGNQAGPEPSRTTVPASAPASSESATPTTTPSPTPSPTPTAFTLPAANPTGPCAATEMELIATAAPTNPTVGVGADFSLTVKNISNRTCLRDIGGAMQELQLRLGEQIVWSSDDCGANQDHFDETFAPGHERTFTRRWDGYITRDGTGNPICGSQVKPDAGNYHLVARLGDDTSPPTPVDVNSSGA